MKCRLFKLLLFNHSMVSYYNSVLQGRNCLYEEEYNGTKISPTEYLLKHNLSGPGEPPSMEEPRLDDRVEKGKDLVRRCKCRKLLVSSLGRAETIYQSK